MELVAKGISKQYQRATGSDTVTAVHELDFELSGGTLVEICGKSGSGKSTLLSMLSGLLAPTAGTVMLDDLDVYSLEDAELSKLRNLHFGIIPQMHSLLANLNVIDNVRLPMTLYKKRDSANRAGELLELLGIPYLAESFPHQLSGGEMRRVAIARALMMDPQFIFADEPTGDLDDENTEIVFSCFRRIADSGASVLLVTHEATARQYADTVLRMNAGVLSVD